MTTIELKEQMKILREQEKVVKKEVARIKKEYLYWKELMTKNNVFIYANNLKDKYTSFEALIIETEWRNTRLSKAEWDFLFTELGYTDTDFFTAFMSWTPFMLSFPIADRKCSICMEWYNDTTKVKNKFKNCNHYCCGGCYNQVRKSEDGFKNCVICRESEQPKPKKDRMAYVGICRELINK